MSQTPTTNVQQEPSSAPSGKTKSFAQHLEESFQKPRRYHPMRTDTEWVRHPSANLGDDSDSTIPAEG